MLNILNRINYGWEELEATILGLLALEHPFIVIGRHGGGKTRGTRMLSMGTDPEGFVHYDATKDDLISIAGIPDSEGFKEGNLRFVAHEKTLWNKTTIQVDEITRASKENQNLWLEIIEERSCFGLPLPYRNLIATANPESYAAAFKLDEALLDRFHAVLPVPELQAPMTSQAVTELIELSMGWGDSEPPTAEEIGRVLQEIRDAHEKILESGASTRILSYLGQVIPELLRAVSRGDQKYISPRTYARKLTETLLAVAACYDVAGEDKPLQRGAVDALRYAVATKLQVSPALLDKLHDTAKSMLDEGSLARPAQMHLELAQVSDFGGRLSFLREHWSHLVNNLGLDGMEKVVGELLQQAQEPGHKERLVPLHTTLKHVGYRGDGIRQLEGRLSLAFQQGLRLCAGPLRSLTEESEADRGAKGRQALSKLMALVEKGELLSDDSPSALVFKEFLIQAWEKQEAPTQEHLKNLVSRIRLKEAA